jgi:CDGSH-type Zn-finger protein
MSDNTSHSEPIIVPQGETAPHPVNSTDWPGGYLLRDGKILLRGYKEPPPLPLAEPHCAAYGSVKLTLHPGKYSWCSCGHSKTQPFCDDSHREEQFATNRKSYKFEVLQEITVSLCVCKQTKNPPFCDASHKELTPPELA